MRTWANLSALRGNGPVADHAIGRRERPKNRTGRPAPLPPYPPGGWPWSTCALSLVLQPVPCAAQLAELPGREREQPGAAVGTGRYKPAFVIGRPRHVLHLVEMAAAPIDAAREGLLDHGPHLEHRPPITSSPQVSQVPSIPSFVNSSVRPLLSRSRSPGFACGPSIG